MTGPAENDLPLCHQYLLPFKKNKTHKNTVGVKDKEQLKKKKERKTGINTDILSYQSLFFT